MTHCVEYNEKLIEDCKKQIAVNKTPIYFPDPIKVQTTPHMIIMKIYGCVMDIDEKFIKVMDEYEKWHLLKASQNNVGYLLTSLLQRLKHINNKSLTM